LWWTADGCHIRVVDLASGRERAAGVPRPKGASDSTPSMWRGRIAFARRDAPDGVPRILVYDPASRRLRRLPGGDTGSSQIKVAAAGIDLGSRLVAFRWFAQSGDGAWEVIADDLTTRRSRLIGTGFIGEVCTGGVDGSAPTTPTTDGWFVLYAHLSSSCFVDTAVLVRVDVRHRRYVRGPLPDETMAGTWYSSGGVSVVAPPPPPPPPYLPTECTTGTPCVLEQLAIPALTPFSPTFEPPLRAR
jgi:hypothetical protein